MAHQYGTLEYERANAIKLAWDIRDAGGLMQGGEQYPNAFNAADASRDLERAAMKETGLPEEEREACLALAKCLGDIYDKGVDIDGVNGEPGGVPHKRLEELAESAMTTGVAAWTP